MFNQGKLEKRIELFWAHKINQKVLNIKTGNQ